MAAFLDVCRFNPTGGSTTDWTYSSAVTGYQSPAAAGVVNGTKYKYRAESADLSQWEIGEGAYNTATGVLARTTVLFNSAGTAVKINFTGAPQVAIVALAEDLISIERPNSFTSAQKDQASTNLGTVRAIRVQKFTASGTYTPDSHLLYCTIEAVGGGAGGGGAAISGAGNFNGSGGGGGGGYSRKIATATAIGVSQAVTIGAAGAAGAAGANNGGTGGDTSIGTICIAKGGAGGQGAASSGNGVGGAGGVAGTGDLTIPGGNGGQGGLNATGQSLFFQVTGCGGSSMYGFGSPAATAGANGNAGTGFGAGGSGASDYNGGGNRSGGPGTAGIVLITEYCSQ